MCRMLQNHFSMSKEVTRANLSLLEKRQNCISFILGGVFVIEIIVIMVQGTALQLQPNNQIKIGSTSFAI